MSKKVFIGVSIVVVLGIAALAISVLRPTAEASAPIEAVPIEMEESEPEAMEEMEAVAHDQDDAEHAEEIAEEKDHDSMAEESESEGDMDGATHDDDSDKDMDSATTGEMAAPEGLIVFTIVQDESEVRFSLDELLRGAPTTVVGVTDQVAGEIVIDAENPANSKVGTILINARTLKTDNDFRNRAINNKILETGKFEFITFNPTGISGFPENPQIGEALVFQITGDLTIRDITNEVTFDAQVTVVSEDRLEAYASTMVAHADYDLTIPDVPSVAEVDKEVLLEIEFVAIAK